jgi:hypothetical protein
MTDQSNIDAELKKIQHTIAALSSVIYYHLPGHKTDAVTKAEYLIEASQRVQALVESGLLENLLDAARRESR